MCRVQASGNFQTEEEYVEGSVVDARQIDDVGVVSGGIVRDLLRDGVGPIEHAPINAEVVDGACRVCRDHQE